MAVALNDRKTERLLKGWHVLCKKGNVAAVHSVLAGKRVMNVAKLHNVHIVGRDEKIFVQTPSKSNQLKQHVYLKYILNTFSTCNLDC